MTDDFIGQIVGGRYEVVRLIGRGAMGTIYEVRHVKLKRGFALKRLVPHLVEDTEALERFQREADIVAQLRHPNVVEIVDWDQLPDGAPCIVMELLRGEDLDQRLRRTGRLSWAEAQHVGDQMLSALGVAHRAGIIHRDLKPQNVFLAKDDAGDEHVKVLDFGISKIHGSHTHVGRLLGTPAYMAPEQADGRSEDVGPATDLWAMGAMLQEMTTGAQAFAGASATAVAYRICHGEPEPIAASWPAAPPAFIALVAQAMRKAPAERFQDAESMRAALAAIGDVEPALPAPRVGETPTMPLEVRPARTHPANSTTLSQSAGELVAAPRVEQAGAPTGRSAPVAPRTKRHRRALFVCAAALALACFGAYALRSRPHVSAPAASGLSVVPTLPSPGLQALPSPPTPAQEVASASPASAPAVKTSVPSSSEALAPTQSPRPTKPHPAGKPIVRMHPPQRPAGKTRPQPATSNGARPLSL